MRCRAWLAAVLSLRIGPSPLQCQQDAETVTTFLVLQTARSLLKALLAVRAGKRVAGNAAYLNDTQTESRSKCSVSSQRDWLDPAHQIAAFRWAFSQHCAVSPRQLMPVSGQHVCP